MNRVSKIAKGDIVYEVQNIRKRIQPLVIVSIYLGRKKAQFSYVELKEGFGIYYNIKGFDLNELGKTVFLTKEEAEAALAGLQK